MEQLERSRESLRGWLTEFVLVSTALAIALVVVVAPWRATALELRDFSEFLPLLESRPTFSGQWQVINEYYRTQGRGNLLTNALIVAGWNIAGKSPVPWQSYELAFLLLLAISLWALLRAAGAGRAVAIGLSLWASCSAGPAAGALRLSAELPIGILLIAMIWIGRDHDARSTMTKAIALAALVGAMLLFKEAAVVFLPVIIGAVLSGRGRPAANVAVVVAVVTVSTVVLTRTLDIARHAPPDAYSQGLNAGNANVFTLVAAARLASPEHWPWMAPIEPLTSWATLAWLGVVTVGCIGAAKNGRAFQVAGLVLTCLGGLALYAAWGRFESFYAAPFIVAQAATAGVGFAYMRGREAWIPIAAGVIIAIGTVHAATGAWRLRDWTVARRAVEFQAAETVSRLGADRRVTIVAEGQPAQAWQGHAATLTRFVRSMWPERAAPMIRDARCADAEKSGPGTFLLVYDPVACPTASLTGSIRREFVVISVFPPRIVRDAYVLGTSGLR